MGLRNWWSQIKDIRDIRKRNRLETAVMDYFNSLADYYEGYLSGFPMRALSRIDARGTNALRVIKKVLASGIPLDIMKTQVTKSLIDDLDYSTNPLYAPRDSARKEVALEVLVLISGRDFGTDISKWRKWWDTQIKT